MSDERLRELERAAPHCSASAAKLMAELLRTGVVDRGRAELLAHLHHEPTLAALGLPYREVRSAEALQEWTKSLARFGKEPLVRAAIVSGDIGVSVHERGGGSLGPRRALEAARCFIEQPTEENRQAAFAVLCTVGPIAGAHAATGIWACWCAADRLDYRAPEYAAFAVSCAAYSARSVERVAATICQVLLAWALDGVPVPRTRANPARPIFISWAISD